MLIRFLPPEAADVFSLTKLLQFRNNRWSEPYFFESELSLSLEELNLVEPSKSLNVLSWPSVPNLLLPSSLVSSLFKSYARPWPRF